MKVQWELYSNESKAIQNPTWEQIHKTLALMDGKTYSSVSLSLTNKGALLVGGGDEQRYIVVYIPENDDNSLTLADLNLTGSEIYLTVEGVISGPYLAKWCVKQDLVLKVFKHFFQTEELPNDLIWESD